MFPPHQLAQDAACGCGITVGQAAAALGVSRQRVCQWIREGRVVAEKRDGQYRLGQDAVSELAERPGASITCHGCDRKRPRHGSRVVRRGQLVRMLCRECYDGAIRQALSKGKP